MGVVIRAAGGVVWRPTGSTGPQVVVVHRPRYDDWSLPKGKLTGDEHPLAAAVREVLEETGVRAVPQVRLPSSRYLSGHPKTNKTVDYWSMRAVGTDDFTAVDEVDEVRWVPVPEAHRLLSYPHDRTVLSAFSALPPVTGLVLLVRHAYAGDKAQWTGPDQERPLDAVGQRSASALSELLTLFAPVRIVSAEPRRCVQTVEPLASALDLPIELDSRFNEGNGAAPAVRELVRAAVSGAVTVVCSQGKLIPPALAEFAGADPAVFHTAKGAGWLLSFSGDSLITAEEIDAHQQDAPTRIVHPTGGPAQRGRRPEFRSAPSAGSS